MEFPLLKELISVFGLSLVVIVFCHRLKIPPIVGFLLTGVIAGPHCLGLISATHEVELLAEIGIILLLFTIGVEFSLTSLLQIKKLVLVAGLAQISVTFTFFYLICLALGLPENTSVIIGFLVTLSSTALALKILQERAEIDSIHGRIAFSILLLQDISIVPMMLLVPHLSPSTQVVASSSIYPLLKGLGVLFLCLVSAWWFVPKLFDQIARTRNKELFLLSVIVVCFAVAFLTQRAGLSLALGALLAGLIISETEYGHHALVNILPFQQIFTTLFFVSVGMLLDVNYTLDHFFYVLSLTFGVIALKAVAVIPAALLLGYSFRSGLLSGLALAQIGEFSFVLAKTAEKYDILSGEYYQIFLNVSVMSMALTPFIISYSHRIARSVSKIPMPRILRVGHHPRDEKKPLLGHEKLYNHALVIGYGVAGRMLVKALEFGQIPYVIIEMNPDTVKKERANGKRIVYGDASQDAVLIGEGVEHAAVAIIVISDYMASLQMVAQMRKLNPSIYIVVRTKMVKQITELYHLGANEVVPEEFETAIELIGRTLKKFLIPFEERETLISALRSNQYEMVRSAKPNQLTVDDLHLHVSELSANTVRVSRKSLFKKKSLADLDFRNRYGVTLLAIKRGNETIANPTADTVLEEDDILFFLGSSGDFDKLRRDCA